MDGKDAPATASDTAPPSADATTAIAPTPLPPVQGLKHFKTLLPLFQRLHEVGCDRDTAGNRTLHYDQWR